MAEGAASPPLRRIARRFATLPGRRRGLLLEAVCWLAAVRVALLFVPFRILAARFGTLTSPGAAQAPTPAASDGELAAAREISWAVTRAARYVPFRAVCLPQAIAAKAMLGRRRIASVMHFGVAKKKDAALAAHAWLDAGPVQVTGYPFDMDFTEVARFV
ncbi:MAG TPA: lasso peptide biosynthesis B2 protein [Rhizomicrobium sp.]|jgi:hypothetical protein|nr:lasso peptide biosynthesis B2 protein [Rhizomicrobium sp.]